MSPRSYSEIEGSGSAAGTPSLSELATITTALSTVHKASQVRVSTNAAPANADVATSECIIWFDNTNGAAKLMLKGKTANGTVVTGSVNLT